MTERLKKCMNNQCSKGTYVDESVVVLVGSIWRALYEELPLAETSTRIHRLHVSELSVVVEEGRELSHHEPHLGLVRIIRLHHVQDVRHHVPGTPLQT